jgi:hypothetical protein
VGSFAIWLIRCGSLGSHGYGRPRPYGGAKLRTLENEPSNTIRSRIDLRMSFSKTKFGPLPCHPERSRGTPLSLAVPLLFRGILDAPTQVFRLRVRLLVGNTDEYR